MSFSFRKLFKKSEQDSGVDRTRLQFDRPQERGLSSTDRSPSVADPDGLTVEGVFASPSPSQHQEPTTREIHGAEQVQSPFQIVEPASGQSEISAASPFQPAEAESLPSSEVPGAGEECVEEVAGLFDAAPKQPVESSSASFFQSVMENGVPDPEESTEPFSSGAVFQEEPSDFEDNSPSGLEGFLSSGTPFGEEPVSSPHELPWVDDPEQNRDGSLPLSGVSPDSLAGAQEEPGLGPAGGIEAELSGVPDGLAPFCSTDPMPVSPEVEDTQPNRSFGDDALPARERPYSSSIPDGPDQFSGFSSPPADDELSERMDTSGELPASFGSQDFPKDEGFADGKDFPVFADMASKDDVVGASPPVEGQPEKTHADPSGFADFSPDDEQGIEDSLSDCLDPESPSVTADVSPGSDREEGLAGPWPMGGVFPLLNAPLKQAEPLESLSPLEPDFPGGGGSSESGDKLVADQKVPQFTGDSHAVGMTGQPTLRALLMTDAEIDGDMVVGHCAGLDGVHQCVACTADGRIKASSMPKETPEIDFLGLCGSVRSLAEAFGAGLEGPLTLRSPEGLVSFFVNGSATLGVLHSEGALKSGVQERLRLIACALNTECK